MNRWGKDGYCIEHRNYACWRCLSVEAREFMEAAGRSPQAQEIDWGVIEVAARGDAGSDEEANAIVRALRALVVELERTGRLFKKDA